MEEEFKRRRQDDDSVDEDGIKTLLDEEFKKNINFDVYCREKLIPAILSDESDRCFDALRFVFQYLKSIYANRNFSLLQLAVFFLPCTEKSCLFISGLKDEVNARGAGGETALFLAIRLNSLAFVKQLAEDGADFALQNDKGEPAITVARQLGDLDMIGFVHLKSLEAASLSNVLFPSSLRLR